MQRQVLRTEQECIMLPLNSTFHISIWNGLSRKAQLQVILFYVQSFCLRKNIKTERLNLLKHITVEFDSFFYNTDIKLCEIMVPFRVKQTTRECFRGYRMTEKLLYPTGMCHFHGFHLLTRFQRSKMAEMLCRWLLFSIRYLLAYKIQFKDMFTKFETWFYPEALPAF